MSFFGFEQNDLEKEKANFLQGRFQEPEDIAVYTWGEESYDGLGNALQEGGDDLNDQTFGDTGVVGKDFDFSGTALPTDFGHPPSKSGHPSESNREQAPQPTFSQLNEASHHEYQDLKPKSAVSSQVAARSTPPSLEAIWHDNSPFSALPGRAGSNGVGRSASDHPRFNTSTSPRPPSAFNGSNTSASQAAPHRFSPFDGHDEPVPIHVSHGGQAGVRTLQEIEAEMRSVAQRQHLQQQKEQQQLLRQRQLMEQEQLRIQQEEQEELLLRQRAQERQQQIQLQQLQRLQQEQFLQERTLQHQRTPPPRMLPVSQSPRFHDAQQRQLLLLQHQQDQQQQLRFHELQERLRMEDLERQLRAQQISQLNQGPTAHRRTPSGPSIADYQAALMQQQLLQQQQQQQTHAQQRRQRSQSPALRDIAQLGGMPLGQGLQYLPQSIQLQQRLLSEMAQAEFLRDMQGGAPIDQEALRTEALRKIVEAEQMEEKRRRKAQKIARMSRYNDLMTQSDKDFITRIQVSQLVTQDPYAEDFYAQVYGAILRSKLGLQANDERVLKFGSGGGVGLGLAQHKGIGRRPNAMQRMEQQVERIVSNARKREEEKGVHSLQSLQGALGKTSGRSYKAAPRQLLQVDSSPTLGHAHAHISKEDSTDHAQEAKKLGREALGNVGDSASVTRREPLTHRQVLFMLEGLYDLVLQAEQLRQDQPSPEEPEAFAAWEEDFAQLLDHLWEGLNVMVPLETSDPHPFISLLMPVKGKKLLPRLCRHLADHQVYTLTTLLVACFDQLDVVKQAPLLDTVEDTEERAEVDRQTQAFLTGGVIQSILPTMSKAPLRIVTGLLGLLLDRTDVAAVSQTKPGLALLTLLLSRVEVIKQNDANTLTVEDGLPSAEEFQQWQLMFDHLFQLLSPHLLLLFPSTRLAPLLPQGHLGIAIDRLDQQTWQFLAAVALHTVHEQQSILVASLREKILDNVMSVNKGWVADEDEQQLKLANVNILLNALGLDSSQITV